MAFLFLIFAIVMVTVVPVMVSARLLGAKNTGFIVCFLAVIGSVLSEHFSHVIIENDFIAGVVTVAVTAVFFSVVLGAKYLQSILIALLSYGVQIAAVFIIAAVATIFGVGEVSI